MPPDDLPPGIWFEPGRSRWRVRLYSGTRVLHLSYHESEHSARSAWTQAQRDKRLQADPELSSAENQFSFLQNNAGFAPRNPLEGLLTLEQMVEEYFARPVPKTTLWKWVREGRIAAIRIGRRYYIKPADAQMFVSQGTA